MTKWYLAVAVALTLLLGLPFPEHETAKLLPIRAIQVEEIGAGVHVVTEAGEGRGEDWASAVEDLRANAPGEVFFDTAEQLVLIGPATGRLGEILDSGELRPAAQVRRRDALEDPEGLADWLEVHESDLTVSDLRAKRAETPAADPAVFLK